MAEIPFRCGYCGLSVFGQVVSQYQRGTGTPHISLLRCPNCGCGSVKTHTGAIHPPSPAGEAVKNLPPEVEQAWQEVRTTYAVAAYTSSEMMCRKILMHLAVDVANAQPGKQFWEYVNALESTGYVLPGLKQTVDSIRDRGNAANHELPASTEAEALQTLEITEFLLKGIYEVGQP